MPLICNISCRAAWSAPCAGSSPRAGWRTWRRAVIEELGRVREELGWPIVMTPFSQILLTQAVMNVTNPERYAVIPGRGDSLRDRPLRQTQRADRCKGDGAHRVAAAHPELRAEPPMASCQRAASPVGRAAVATKNCCCAPRCRPARSMPCWRRRRRRDTTIPAIEAGARACWRRLAAHRDLDARIGRQARLPAGTASRRRH